ncbi:MAG TPA: [acyl-carrier-protein] S-malonyltransferase [Verrucomicrobia bacterium]|nr:MAG: [acyl-carrier-protein] S-malonyltransferase [Lentisphaerae bacterium GWF2_57_35]HBA83174.1 [acyl-carrier-protein] S-malonyltransferase [Verrucomicrobiota bacterium]
MSMRAILFPGQGAQAVGMGRDLAEAIPECRDLFNKASQVLGFDLAKVCFEGPIEDLTKSSNAQPAIFVASLACQAALRRAQPALNFASAAGLSSGEWTALHMAGVVSFEDTLRILEARGRFMQEACEEQPGAMLSIIGLDLPALEKVAAEAGVQIANLNSPEQTVLSGPKGGIEKAEPIAKAAGAKKAIRLNVSGAFHSSLMNSAARRLSAVLSQISFQAPQIPVMSNVTGKPHETPDSIRRLMVEQVTSSVQWVACVRAIQALGVRSYVECGPGKVLSGLVRRIDKEASIHNISDLPSAEAAGTALNS